MLGYHDGNWGRGDWLAMGSMMLLFWAVVIGLVVWAVRSARHERQNPDSGRTTMASPDDILAGRFARGEIEEAEFLHRRELLHATSGSVTQTRSTP
ncbi:MAG: SHOCT domain-containing protein [Sporichthyaceae bacterium]